MDIPWTSGAGNIVVTPISGGATVASDSANEDVDRQQDITFKTAVGDISVVRTVRQSGTYEYLEASDGQLTDSSSDNLKVKK